MSPVNRAALTDCIANLTATVRALSNIGASVDTSPRERDGIAVLAAEIDSIVEGIGTLLSGGGEK